MGITPVGPYIEDVTFRISPVRLYLEDSLLQQVRQTRLLGVIVSDNLSWHANTANLVKRCYQRMMILNCPWVLLATQHTTYWGMTVKVNLNKEVHRFFTKLLKE